MDNKWVSNYINELTSTNEAISKSDRLKIYKDLNKGDLIDIKYDSANRKGDGYKSFVVSKGKTKVGKQKVERIALQLKDKPKTVKFYLYNINNNISLAIGNMAASIVDIKKPANEAVNESKVSNSDILDVIDSIQGLIKNIKNDNSKKSSKLFSMAGPLVKELHKLVESVNTPIK